MQTTSLAVAFSVPRSVRGFRDWMRTHRGAIAMAGLLALAGPLTFFTGATSVLREPRPAEVFELALWWTLYGVTLWCLLLVAGYACQQLLPRFGYWTRGALWTLAACGAAGSANLVTAGRATILIDRGVVSSTWTMHLYAFAFSLIMALLYFAHLRRSGEHEQAAARLAAAQAAQRDAQRRVAESRLQEVQARVDPQVLFNMLEAVRDLYERDAGQAEQFLDELIVFLRSALPRLRSASSSLPREVELACSYVKLRAVASGSSQRMAVDVAPAAIHARFPPGVLLPLIDASAGIGVPRRIAASRVADACRLVLSVDNAPATTSVERVRAQLFELYGESGTLSVRTGRSETEVEVEIPYELA